MAHIDYWLYKFKYDPEVDEQYENDYYEIIGVTGGIIKIFQFFNNTGSLMLHFIHEQLKKEHQQTRKLLQAKKKQTKEIGLEMIAIENIKHKITDSPKNIILDKPNIKTRRNTEPPIKIIREYENNSDDSDNDNDDSIMLIKTILKTL